MRRTLSGFAKDLGSGAVLLSLVAAALTWIFVLADGRGTP
jgi:diacylglycerol kinase